VKKEEEECLSYDMLFASVGRVGPITGSAFMPTATPPLHRCHVDVHLASGDFTAAGDSSIVDDAL
jgi:hypothetical protein